MDKTLRTDWSYIKISKAFQFVAILPSEKSFQVSPNIYAQSVHCPLWVATGRVTAQASPFAPVVRLSVQIYPVVPSQANTLTIIQNEKGAVLLPKAPARPNHWWPKNWIEWFPAVVHCANCSHWLCSPIDVLHWCNGTRAAMTVYSGTYRWMSVTICGIPFRS